MTVCYITLQKGLFRFSKIFLNYQGGLNIISWILKSGRERQKYQAERYTGKRPGDILKVRGACSLLLTLKMKTAKSQECTLSLETETNPQPKALKQTKTSVLPTEFHQQLEWAWKWIHPQRPTLLIISFQTREIWSRDTSQAHQISDLQNSKIINLCYIKLLNLWQIVMVSVNNKYICENHYHSLVLGYCHYF